MLEKFRVQKEVEYRDLDPFNHVNNAVFFSYFETARVHFLHEYFQSHDRFAFFIAHAEIDYFKPAFLLDKLMISVWVSRVGRTSFTFSYEISRGEEKIAEGKTVQVVVDLASGKPKEIPESLLEYLKRYSVVK